MKIHFTEPALVDLNEAVEYTRKHFPSSVDRFEERIRTTIKRIALWPEIAPAVDEERDVRVARCFGIPIESSTA